MDDIFGFVKGIAPTIAGLLGTPAAGVAVEALIKAFDGDDGAVKAIQDGTRQLSSDDIARIKLAEIAAKQRTEEIGLSLESLSVDDRKSARERQASVRDSVPSILAYAVTIGFFGILGYSITNGLPDNQGLVLLIGSLGTAWTGIMAYYFGSSAGSARKTEMMGK